MMFVLNEKTSDRTVYQYVSREPFKGTIEEEGSTIKVSFEFRIISLLFNSFSIEFFFINKKN
jgi:hypothetical protein